ncbi:hypothetical protein ES703_15035 [subsurface metagenome]
MGSHSKAVVTDIALNKVKLPSPEAGDYVTPGGVLASSSDNLGNHELREPVPPNNKANIYDMDDETSARGDGNELSEAELIVWDLGSIASRKLIFKHRAWAGSDPATSRLQYSETDGGWLDLSVIVKAEDSGEEFKEGEETKSCRYLRWMGKYDETNSDAFVDLFILMAEGADTRPENTISENTGWAWRPNPVNEAGAYCRWDMGALKITSGCRLYWGADANYRPTAYRLEVSETGSTWTTVKTESEAAPASDWKEYSWNARYARYIRLIVDTHGATGTEIFEADYYSRLIDRVASEHGHGSGIEPHLQVIYSEGHPKMAFGYAVREKVKQKLLIAKDRASVPNLLELIDAQNEAIEFLVKD